MKKKTFLIIVSVVLVCATVIGVGAHFGVLDRILPSEDPAENELIADEKNKAEIFQRGANTNEGLGIVNHLIFTDELKPNTSYEIRWKIDASIYGVENINIPVNQKGNYCVLWRADRHAMVEDTLMYNLFSTNNEQEILAHLTEDSFTFTTGNEGNVIFAFWQTPKTVLDADVDAFWALNQQCYDSITFELYELAPEEPEETVIGDQDSTDLIECSYVPKGDKVLYYVGMKGLEKGERYRVEWKMDISIFDNVSRFTAASGNHAIYYFMDGTATQLYMAEVATSQSVYDQICKDGSFEFTMDQDGSFRFGFWEAEGYDGATLKLILDCIDFEVTKIS